MNHEWGEGDETYENSKTQNILSQLVSIFHVHKKSGSPKNHIKDFEKSYEMDINPPKKSHNYGEFEYDRPNKKSTTSSIPKSHNLPSEHDENYYAYNFDKKKFPLINAKMDAGKEGEKIKKRKEIDTKDKKKVFKDKEIDKIKEVNENKEKDRIKKVEKDKEIYQKEIIHKMEIHYAGLKNQGATCYLNSILQTLFHIPAFRKLIFTIPFDITTQNTQDKKNIQNSSENNDENIFDFQQFRSHHRVQTDNQTNVILNLQALFAQLQTSRESASTQNLTLSFGWDYEQTQIQQDIHEFCIHLLDYIKNKLKNTPYSKVIDDLFMIHTRTYYKGINVNFEETSDDNFLVLSVVVKGFSTLNESLHSLLTTQYLRGESQFESPKYGKQDASLTTKFLKFPKVLFIHLKRFEFDTKLNRNIKINSILMFKEKLDISEFLSEIDSEQQELGSEYELHGVLVHDGYTEGGHYYAYIRPSSDPQWYKFNDSFVTAVDKFEAIDNNFGGPDSNNTDNTTSLFPLSVFSKNEEPDERTFSAYMLVYVRKSSIDEIFCPIDDSIISEKVKNFLIEENEKVNQIQINIVDEKCLAMNAFKGRISFYSSKKYVKKIYISNSFSIDEFFHSVASQLKIDNYLFSLCEFEDDHITKEINRNSNKSVIKSLQNGSSLFCLLFDNYHVFQDLIFIFMYVYIRFLNHPLRYLTKTLVNTNNSIYKTLNEKIKYELNLSKPYKTCIYVKNGPVLTYIEDEHPVFDHYQSEMYVIDIIESAEMDDIIFEKGFMQDDEKKYSARLINYFDYIDKMPKSSYDYFEAINDKSKIKIKIVGKYDSPIQIKYSNSCLFEEFVHFIRKIVDVNEDQEINIYKSYEVLPIRQDVNLSRINYQVLSNPKYLIINVSNEIEYNTALLEIIYSNDSIRQDHRFPVLVRKDMTVNNILEELKNGITELKSNKDTTLRLLQMNEENNGLIKGIIRVLKTDELAYNLRNPLRIEPIPEDQFDVPSEYLIPVLFNDKNTQKTVNFLLLIITGEIFAETKERIQVILQKDNYSMGMMKYYFVSDKHRETLKDDYIISNVNFRNCQIKITQMPSPKMETNEIKIYN